MSSHSASSKSPAGSSRTVLTMRDLQQPQVPRSRSRSKSAKSKKAAVTKECVAEAKRELVAQLLEEELPMEAPTVSVPVRAPSPAASQSAPRKSTPAPAPSRSASRSQYMASRSASRGTAQKVLEDEQVEAKIGRSAARSADRAASRASAIARNASPTDVDFVQEEEKVRRLSMKSAMKSNRAMSAEARVVADAEMEESGNVAKSLVQRVMSVLTLAPTTPASEASMSPPRRSKSRSTTYSIPSVVTPPAYRPIR